MQKKKLMNIRVDNLFLKKLDYLSSIMGENGRAETIRLIIAKEFLVAQFELKHNTKK